MARTPEQHQRDREYLAQLTARSSIYGAIADKIRRALRNGTGCKFTNAEVVAIVRSPIYMMLVEHERREMLAEIAPGVTLIEDQTSE